MNSQQQTSKRVIRPLGGLALLIALLCGLRIDARAASTCSIGFPNGTVITVDGLRGADWTDAAVISSGDACLDKLLDEDGLMKNVRVFTKRYTRLGVPFIAFFFEVQDTSTSGTCASGLLCNGERIVLQFDPNKSLGTEIAGAVTPAVGNINSDYQIVITHKWESSGGDPNVVANVTVKVFGRGTAGVCTKPRWVEITTIPVGTMPTVVVRKDLAPGYKAEIEIPLALLGTPTSDIGVAFAVINDFGTNTMGVTDGYGVSFPNLLPVTNAENPVTGCRGNWVVPNEWGTGFFGPAAGDVAISRLPDFWDSNQILVRQCNSAGANYTWYKDNPCKAVIESHLQNTTGSTQIRNLLFLWAQFGTGDPLDYKVVALVENQSVPNGLSAGPFVTPPWTNMPTGSLQHPCVRVYVLPPNFLVSFTKSDILAITTRARVLDMMTAYGLGNQHWAQKNISASTTIFTCPTCPIAELRDFKQLKPASSALDAVLAQSSPPRKESIDEEGAGLEAHMHLPPGTRKFLPVSYAPPAAEPVLHTQATGTTTGQRPPIVRDPGKNILMSREELAKFSRDNVIVQVRTFGFSKFPVEDPRYNFIEHMGGVIQLIPVEMLQAQRTVLFQFNVVNADLERTIFHKVDVFFPPGVSGAQVGLNTAPSTYTANETRVQHGMVTLTGGGGGGGGGGGAFERFGISLHAGVSIPHGSFANFFDPGPNVAFDFEYRIRQDLSLEGIFGFHRFNGKVAVEDLNVYQLSGNLKYYFPGARVRPFVNFGAGAYALSPGGTHVGTNIGFGLQVDVSSRTAIEAGYNFHSVFTSGSNLKFSAVEGGFRFRF